MANKHKKYKSSKYNISIEEAYKLLTSKEKKHWMCNFDAIDPSKVGTRRKTRKNQIPKWFKKFHEEEFKPLQKAVLDLNTKPPKYFLDFQKQMLDFVKEQREFNKLIMSRIDNLVSKNNLKE